MIKRFAGLLFLLLALLLSFFILSQLNKMVISIVSLIRPESGYSLGYSIGSLIGFTLLIVSIYHLWKVGNKWIRKG